MSDRPVPKRIKSMDELLMAVEPERQAVNIKSGVVRLKFSQVDPYPNHPFRLYSGERLEDMVASISNYGILTPMIVRIKDHGRYEMLAGHSRMNAGTLAGLDEGDFIIKENLSDEEVWMYVIETNVMQRSFADMLLSEKAAVLSLRHSKMFSQGKRNDIIAELKMLEQLGFQAASWSTAAIANTWLGEEGLFNDLKTIKVPTLILHGVNDQVCLFPLAIAQKNSIKNSKLVPFEACGHFLFYDQRDRFNKELIQFIEE